MRDRFLLIHFLLGFGIACNVNKHTQLNGQYNSKLKNLTLTIYKDSTYEFLTPNQTKLFQYSRGGWNRNGNQLLLIDSFVNNKFFMKAIKVKDDFDSINLLFGNIEGFASIEYWIKGLRAKTFLFHKEIKFEALDSFRLIFESRNFPKVHVSTNTIGIRGKGIYSIEVQKPILSERCICIDTLLIKKRFLRKPVVYYYNDKLIPSNLSSY